ncbi:MAG: nucleotidyltransferase domain-containing protein [Fibromonadaceae bacterium]|nr:nucleotidyltransferase domain-containing protein [Fibromonadaceae bacterium]
MGMQKTTSECIELLKAYKEKNADKYGIECIGIFGSFARGEQNNISDLDVYFESDTISLFQMGSLLCDLENLLGIKIDLVHKHKRLRTEFLNTIKRDIIYA